MSDGDSKWGKLRKMSDGIISKLSQLKSSLIRENSVCKSSEEYLEYMCDPCRSLGDQQEAFGFCNDCDEYLCGTCFECHSQSKDTSKHVLLDKDSMPKKFCDPCNRAGKEKEAAEHCVDCGRWFCTDCDWNHSLKRAARNHTKENMHKASDFADSCNNRETDATYNEEYTYIRDIESKVDIDEKNCYITDMILVSKTELVLADLGNQSLKLVDTEHNVVKHTRKLQTPLHGITAVSQREIAILPAKKCEIQILSVSKGLSVARTLKTGGHCSGITHSNGRLFVSLYDPLKFQIVKLTGEIDKTINPDSEVMEHCTTPRHIAVSPGQDLIYVSDWRTHSIMSVDMDGRMRSIYQGQLLKPLGITVSPLGQLYLCNRDEHVLFKMSPDLAEADVKLGKEDGLEYPQTMCFDADMQYLYISSGNCQHGSLIKMFEWK